MLWFPASLLLTISWLLSSWVPLPGRRKIMQLRASGGLYCRESENGSSDPKFNNVGWYLGVKTSACGICWTLPPNMRAGQHYRGKALSLGAGVCCFTAVPAGGVQGLGPSSPCYSHSDQDIADGGKTGISKRMLLTWKLDLFLKTSSGSFSKCRGDRRTTLDSSTLQMSQWF